MKAATRIAVLAFAVSLLPLAGPGASAAQGPGAAPAHLVALRASVLIGDRYEVTCDEVSTAGNAAYVVFFVLLDPSSKYIYGGQGWAQFGTDAPALRVSVGDTPLAIQPPATLAPEAAHIPDTAGAVRSDGVLRAAWASWGSPIDCDVVVNGVELGETSLDPNRAVQARLGDFTGVASADADLAGAGASLEFKRDVDGYVYAWFWASGSITNKGPGQNQQVNSKDYFVPGIATGTWTFSTTVAYERGAPRAFLLETPL